MLPGLWFSVFGSFMFTKLFGTWVGALTFFLLDYFCIMVGCQLAFWNGRYLFRKCVNRSIEGKPKLMAVQNALSYNSKKMVALSRLCYVTPYSVLNYMCAVSNMTSLNYFIGNLFMLPCIVPTIYVGSSISNATEVENTSSLGFVKWIIMVVAGVILVIVFAGIVWYSRKELKKVLDEQKAIEEKEKAEQEA